MYVILLEMQKEYLFSFVIFNRHVRRSARVGSFFDENRANYLGGRAFRPTRLQGLQWMLWPQGKGLEAS